MDNSAIFTENKKVSTKFLAVVFGYMFIGLGITALIGFAGAPWTVACYMVEGRGGGEFKHARRMIHSDPGLFGALIEKLEAATLAYLLAQAEAGAEVLMLFDSWAGQLSPMPFANG